MNMNLFSRPAEQIQSPADKRIDVRRLDFILPPAGASKKLFGQLCTGPDLLLDAFKFVVMGIMGVHIQEYQRGVSLNAHKQIIKIMGDTTGQGSYRLHLLRLQELDLHFLLRGYVSEKIKGCRAPFPDNLNRV